MEGSIVAGWTAVPNGDTSAWKPVRDSAPQHQYTADEANGSDFRDTFEKQYVEPQMAPPNESLMHHVGRAASNFGGGVIGGLTAPILHPLETAKMAAFPLAGLVDPSLYTPEANQLKEGFKAHPEEAMESLGGNLVGGADAMGMAGEALPKIADAIPTRAKAGKLFESVMQDAGDKPVNLTRTMAPLERMEQLSSRGHGTISAADNLYKRVNTVNPLDYREARDWASGASRLSAQDKMSASPSLRSNFKQMSHALNDDIGDTATSVGRGEDYAKAMQDYRRASTMADAASAVGKVAKRMAIPAAVGAGGYSLYHALDK
jgi:hypothetical protein